MKVSIDEPNKRVVFIRGGGALMVFGLLFAGAGGSFVFLLLSGGEVTVNGRPGTPLDAWMPAIMMMGGLLLGFTRYRRELNIRGGYLTRRVTIFGAQVWADNIPTGALQHVTVTRETRRSNNNSNTTVFPVRVQSTAEKSGAINLGEYSSDLKARREAEKVAKLAAIAMHDHTMGSLTVREHHELDMSVIETMRVPATRPVPPPACRIDVVPDVAGAKIAIRLSLARTVGKIVLSVLAMAIPLGFWALLWRPKTASIGGLFGQVFGYAPLVFIALTGLIISLRLLRRGLWGQTLGVSREGIEVRSLVGRAFLSTAAVEELHSIGGAFGGSLVARTDDRQLRLGEGLSDPERTYLRNTLLYYLGGGR